MNAMKPEFTVNTGLCSRQLRSNTVKTKKGKFTFTRYSNSRYCFANELLEIF